MGGPGGVDFCRRASRNLAVGRIAYFAGGAPGRRCGFAEPTLSPRRELHFGDPGGPGKEWRALLLGAGVFRGLTLWFFQTDALASTRASFWGSGSRPEGFRSSLRGTLCGPWEPNAVLRVARGGFREPEWILRHPILAPGGGQMMLRRGHRGSRGPRMRSLKRRGAKIGRGGGRKIQV